MSAMLLSDGASSQELRDVHDTMRLRPYLAALWSRRAYAIFVSTSELRSRQMATALGNLWHLLNPILLVAVYYVVFGVLIGDVSRGADNYILFLSIGIFVFTDAQRAALAGAASLLNNKGLIRALQFPRALIPLTAALTEALATVPSIPVVYFTAVVTGASIRWSWLLFPIVLAGQFLFNAGLALLASRATNHVQDLQQVLPFIFRLLFYASGVIFAVDVIASPSHRVFFEINPFYAWIAIARWSIMGGGFELVWLISAGAWTAVVLGFGITWFRRGEAEYGRD